MEDNKVVYIYLYPFSTLCGKARLPDSEEMVEFHNGTLVDTVNQSAEWTLDDVENFSALVSIMAKEAVVKATRFLPCEYCQ